MSVALDRLQALGEVYDALDACDQLALMLARLRRQQQFMSEADHEQCKEWLAQIRSRLDTYLAADPAALFSNR